MHRDVFPWVARVRCLDPCQGRRHVGAPLVLPRTRRYGIERNGQVVYQRTVKQLLRRARRERQQLGPLRKHFSRQGVAEGPVQLAEEHEATVRRRTRFLDQSLRAERFHGSMHWNERQLRRRVEREDRLVRGRLEQVLVGPRRGDLSEVLLDVRACGRRIGCRRRAAVRGHGLA